MLPDLESLSQEKGNIMATINEVRNFFGMSSAQFRAEWSALSDESKAEIKAMIEAEKEEYYSLALDQV